MDKEIDVIENHILKAQVYLECLKKNYIEVRQTWRSIRDEIKY